MKSGSLSTVLAAALFAALLPTSPAPAAAPPPAAAQSRAPASASAEEQALLQAAALNEPVEVPELTSETFRVVAQPDGTLEAESSAEPVRVRRGTSWAAVDTTLIRRPDGTVGPATAAVDVSFSGGGDRSLVRLADDTPSVQLDWPNTLPAPVLSGDKAMYPDVFPDVDLVVQAGVEGFSSYLVVKNAQAAANPALTQLSLPVTGNQVTVGHTTEGGLTAHDGQGREVFDAPPARMWDSYEAPPEEGTPLPAAIPPRDSFQATVAPMGSRESQAQMAIAGGNRLTITPDPGLLRGPDTVYPVTIDPALSTAIKRKNWTMIWSNGYNFRNHPTEHARVGFDGWSGQRKASRVFYQFNTGALRGKHILKAVFRARQVHSPHWDCARVEVDPAVQLWRTGATSGKTTWGNQPAWQQFLAENKMKKGHSALCGDPIDVEWNAEPAVETAAANRWSVLTLGLRSADESTKWSWRKYDNTSSLPVLTVRYNSPPTKPVGLTFHTPRKQCDSILAFAPPALPRPTLQATLTDPDRSGSLKARFEVWRNGSPDQLVWWGVPTAAVSPGQIVQITVGTTLQNNVPYFFRVRGEETQTDAGYGTEPVTVSPWAAGCDFTVDTQRPPPPKVNSTDYPPLDQAGTEYGAVGRNGAFTLTPGAADVRSFRYRLNDGPWHIVDATSGGPTQVGMTPGRQGTNLLRVHARDAAGFESEDANYLFKVAPGVAAARVWQFDETSGSTAADTSIWPTKFPLTVVTGTSAPAWSPNAARHAGALQLDGVDDYATANQPAIQTSGSFTLATWVRLTDLTENQAIAHQVRSDGRLGFLLYYSRAENRWGFQRAHPTDPVAVATIFSKLPPAAGAWTHLAATYDASEKQLRLYVNGVAQGAVAYPYTYEATGTFEVGRWRYPGVPGSTLQGRIDQMMLFSRQTTTEELYRLVKVPNLGDIPQPGLVGHWKFDDPDGTTATDSSGYGSTATLGTGASFVSDPEHGRVLKVDSRLTAKATAGGPQIDGTGSFTLMAHVRPDSPTYRGFVLAAGSHAVPGGYENYGLGLSRDDPDRWVFTRRNHVNDPPTRSTVSSAALDADDYGKWVHLAAVYDSTTRTMSLYRNGTWQGSAPFTAAWHSTGQIMIGGEIPGSAPTSSFSGLIDDVRVYAGAMTEGQIGVACGFDCWWTTKLTEQEDE